MGVNAKLFVTCGEEKGLPVMRSVAKALGKYTRDKLREHCGSIPHIEFVRSKAGEKYTNGLEKIIGYDGETFRFIFGNGDGDDRSAERRMLWMNTTCSCNYSDTYKGSKIIFSIGHWGSCDEIMLIVAEAVREFGDVYYDHCDSDDEDFIKLFEKDV
jgi:hypothetical protein